MGSSCHKFFQLSIIERSKIELLHEQGCSISKIAAKLDRAKSTISTELRRHRYKATYRAATAQNRANKAKLRNRKPKKANNQELMQQIERMLKKRCLLNRLFFFHLHSTSIYDTMISIKAINLSPCPGVF